MASWLVWRFSKFAQYDGGLRASFENQRPHLKYMVLLPFFDQNLAMRLIQLFG